MNVLSELLRQHSYKSGNGNEEINIIVAFIYVKAGMKMNISELL